MKTPVASPAPVPPFAAFLAFDWSDQKHDVRLVLAGSSAVETCVLPNPPEAFHPWIQKLRERVGGQPVAVAFEAHRGALFHLLLSFDFLVLYPIHPQSAARFREAFYPSGAKSDPLDADLLLEMLRQHHPRLRALCPDDAPTRLLGLLAEGSRQWVDQRTALVHQLSAQLQGYFPQALELAGDDLTQPMAWDFLSRWNSLAALKKAQPSELRAFYYAHRCRSEERIEQRLKRLPHAQPLTEDPAVSEASQFQVHTLVSLLRAVQASIDQYDQRLEALLADHPDAFIFQSLPGAGPVLATRLLVALGTDRNRWDGVAELQVVSGVAPVIVGSGKSRQVLHRWAKPRFLHQSFVEFAQCSLPRCEWVRTLYDAQRQRGKNHWTALRTVAFRWMRVIFRCGKDRVAYSESLYLKALQQHGSPHLPKPGE